MGKIVAFVTQKGGVGKTCAAVNYACWIAKHRGKTVRVIDADTQQSALTWLHQISPDFPVDSITNADDLIERSPELAEGVTRLVIDGPGQIAEISRGILLVCDLAVVPCQPSGLDLHSCDSAFRLIRQAQQIRSGQPEAVVFLSRAFPNTRLTKETAQVLSEISGVTFLKPAINQRQVVSDCFGQGASIWGISGRSAKTSATEYEKLFRSIEKALL